MTMGQGVLIFFYHPCKACGNPDLSVARTTEEVGGLPVDARVVACRKCGRFGSVENWNKVN